VTLATSSCSMTKWDESYSSTPRFTWRLYYYHFDYWVYRNMIVSLVLRVWWPQSCSQNYYGYTYLQIQGLLSFIIDLFPNMQTKAIWSRTKLDIVRAIRILLIMVIISILWYPILKDNYWYSKTLHLLRIYHNRATNVIEWYDHSQMVKVLRLCLVEYY
jgi:hypothetical protein